MSDIGIEIPLIYIIPLIGAAYWPVTLTVALVVLGLAFVVRGVFRFVLIALSVILLADSALALWMPD